MTTEIAIMNRSAIALAADSAVTHARGTQKDRKIKVRNTANKLFALSKYAPVGLMIYGNASLNGVPWETVVKMYRHQLGVQEFSTLEAYCEDFIKYLDKLDVPSESQQEYVIEYNAIPLFLGIRSDINSWVKETTSKGEAVSQQEIQTKLTLLTRAKYDKFSEYGEDSKFTAEERSKLVDKYRSHLSETVNIIFEKLPFDDDSMSQLLSIAINAACFGPANQSGVVIAGFGIHDKFPQYYDYDIAAIFEGKAISSLKRNKAISYDNVASIVPFAQSNDVSTFLQGIGPSLSKYLKNALSNMIITHLPGELADVLRAELRLSEQSADKLKKMATEVCKRASEVLFSDFEQQKRKQFVDPILDATASLDKSELADMAETLVNLVSFRKQVSMEAETVGGPIDVAVITKGDGFIWIKRKHYFSPKLNHHFFSNYNNMESEHV